MVFDKKDKKSRNFVTKLLTNIIVMFCKKCGKEIPNDAHFCTYCGTNQGGNNHEYVTRLVECVKKSVKKHRIIARIYFVWVLLHLCLYVFSSHDGVTNCFHKGYYRGEWYKEWYFECNVYNYDGSDARDCFYPFSTSLGSVLKRDCYYHSSLLNHIDVYDFSELFFYTIIFPLVIYGLVKITPRCFRYCKSLYERKRRS